MDARCGSERFLNKKIAFEMPKNRRYFDLIILAGFSFLFFYPSLGIYFLSENIAHIEKSRFLLTNFQFGYYYRPIWALTLLIDKCVWGANYSGYHFSNLLFHVLTAILVYLLAFQFVRSRFFALVGSFLFLLHPIHALSIFWISGRTDTICAIFYLSALVLFISFQRSNKFKYQVLSILAFILSLLSKEMAVSLPLIIFAYIFLFNDGALRAKFIQATKKSAPYFIIMALIFLIKFLFVQEMAFENVVHRNRNILQIIKNFAVYIGLLIVPGGHITIADFLHANPIFFWLLSFIVLIIFFTSLYWIRKSIILIFFIAFVIITLIPVSRLMMRWYLYIPSAGFCLAIAFGLYRLHESTSGRKLSICFFVVIALMYSGFLQIEQWRWIKAGDISQKISYEIARVIAEHSFNEYYFLNTPAELEEIPVMIFGIESLVNFRLRNEFAIHEKKIINPLSYVSLKDTRDLEAMDIQKLSNGIYQLDLTKTDSHFIFPNALDIINKKRGMEKNIEVEEDYATTKILDINNKKEADIIRIRTNQMSVPVLFYKGGAVKLMKND